MSQLVTEEVDPTRCGGTLQQVQFSFPSYAELKSASARFRVIADALL